MERPYSKLYKAKEIIGENTNFAYAKSPKGDQWIPARPLGIPSLLNRIELAIRVLKGEVDCIEWDERK